MMVYVLITRTDGSVVHMSWPTEGPHSQYPGKGWYKIEGNQMWGRDATSENIQRSVDAFSVSWVQSGDFGAASWRIMTDAEHTLFETDRKYRDALEHVEGKLQHSMPKAREIHRRRIEHDNGDKLLHLDRKWVDAAARNRKAAADSVQSERQALRDKVTDPRIDAAKTVDELKAIV